MFTLSVGHVLSFIILPAIFKNEYLLNKISLLNHMQCAHKEKIDQTTVLTCWEYYYKKYNSFALCPKMVHLKALQILGLTKVQIQVGIDIDILLGLIEAYYIRCLYEINKYNFDLIFITFSCPLKVKIVHSYSSEPALYHHI